MAPWPAAEWLLNTTLFSSLTNESRRLRTSQRDNILPKMDSWKSIFNDETPKQLCLVQNWAPPFLGMDRCGRISLRSGGGSGPTLPINWRVAERNKPMQSKFLHLVGCTQHRRFELQSLLTCHVAVVILFERGGLV